VKARHETKLAEYEATHRDLKREMDNYTVSGRDNWNDFKTVSATEWMILVIH
jgi:hypothetical protein